MELSIRNAGKADVPLITSNWLNSYRHAPAVETVPNTLYFRHQHKVLEDILPSAIVLVACDSTDPNHVAGWLCAEFMERVLVIHYVYVKGALRKEGIGKLLFKTIRELQETTYGEKPDPFFFFTHRVNVSKRGMAALGGIYNPYLLASRGIPAPRIP